MSESESYPKAEFFRKPNLSEYETLVGASFQAAAKLQ